MSASGFGRDAGPVNRGPGTAAFAFGAGAATPPATPAPFTSPRPVAPVGAAAAVSRFPSPRPRPQLAAAVATPRTPATSPVPIPSSSAARPAIAPGVANPVRFPSSRPVVNPGVSAATVRHVARHVQPPPRPAASSIHSPVHPVVSSRSRSTSPLSNQRVDSPSGYDNGMGQRRLVNYADPLFENGSAPIEKMRGQPSEFGKTARSSPLNITSNFRPPSGFQNYYPVLAADPLEYKPNVKPSMFGNQNQSLFNDVQAASSPPLSNNRLVPGTGRLRPAFGGGASPAVLGDESRYDNSAQSIMALQEMSEHMRPSSQRFPSPSQSRSLDHNISKRSRSPTLSHQDADGAEAHNNAGANARRLIDYRDSLFDDGMVETSKRMKSPSLEFTNLIKSPSSGGDNTRPSPAGSRGNNAVQNRHSRADIQKASSSVPKVENQVQSHIGDARSPPYQSGSYSNERNTAAVSPPKTSTPGASKRIGTPPLDFTDDDNMIPSTETEREKQAKAKRLARFSVELNRPVDNINDFAKPQKDSSDKHKQSSSMGKITTESNDGTNERSMADADSRGLAAIVGLCPDMCPEPERAERERKGDLDRYERLDGDRNQTTELLAVKKYNRTAERDADLIRPLPVLQKTMDYLLSLLDHTYDDNFLGLYNFLWDRMRAIRMDLRMQHFFNQYAISMLEQMIRLHIIAMHELCEYNKGEGFSEGFDAHLNIEQMNKTSVELFQMYDDHRREGVLFPTEKEFRGYYALLKLDKHPGYKVEPAELSLDLAKMSREIRGSPDILFAREVARMGNFIAFFRLARKATYLQACLMHAHFAKLRRQALASLHSGLQNSQGIPISQVVEWLAMEDEDIESLVEYYGFGLRQYEELYLVKEGPFLNSETDFSSGCSQLVHLKKSQRIINDVSSGPACASTCQKETVAPYSGGFASPTRTREQVKTQPSLLAKRDFGMPFTASVSPTSARQTTSLYSGPFSPKAGNKQFSLPSSSPISPTSGKKESIPVLFSTPSPHTSNQTIFSRTGWIDEQRGASPKAESNTKVADDFIPEDQDDSVVGFPQGQPDVLWPQANIQQDNALEETNFLRPLADVSLNYSSMHGEENEFRPDSSGIDMCMDEESLSDRQVNLVQPESFADSQSSDSDHEEYDDHKIGYRAADNVLPVVVSPKKTVSNERLKIILRKWRQCAMDKRFLREQKNALAIAALSSLSLGPPVHQTAVVPLHTVHDLDIRHAFEERHSRQQLSLSPLNVSELAGPILTERNPDARCICWKLLVLVPPDNMEFKNSNYASKWLLKKIMGSGNDDAGLLFSSTDLSIWTNWNSSPDTCCLSVARASDQQVIGNDVAYGTNCIIFLVSETIPWEMQKAQVSSLLASIPAKSNLPLLILSGDTYTEEYDYASRSIIDSLGLSSLSEEKIASCLVVFLVADNMEGYANGFFDDEKLRGGLKWLTKNMPLQPDVTLVKTRELLLNYLNPSLELLNSRAAPQVCPEHCISVYNKSVNQLAEEVSAAAYTASNQCPAPEINLLERSSSERMFAEMFLPSMGWSLPSRIHPLLVTIKSCKLPEFSYDLSWLNQGSHMGSQIQDQKLYLEECLTKYLTQSAHLLNEAQAATEVKVIVQKGVGLELRGSHYRLVPRWVTIFRRIFNWRLARLSTGEFSEAYVLSQNLYQTSSADPNPKFPNRGGTQHDLSASSNTTDDEEVPILEDRSMTPSVSSGLSLDEIIEISCDLDAVSVPPAKPLPPQLPTQLLHEPQPPAATNGGVNGVGVLGAGDGMRMRMPRRPELKDLVPMERDDKLARLLEQCSKVQDRIDDTLSIYF
ncbi:SAC3 family protein B isoform X2 [Oryza brachyantha]|uniref:SAC3 family protein B isoform X2 n=1 Tax=Oryza brachyantha TaxID=4533 RepID=UPI001AD9D296|nr:SAC3 family protein B isoform X2 [Oryza brachyantha]